MGKNKPLKISAQKLKNLVDNLPDVVFSFSVIPPIGINFINSAISNLTFYTPQDFYHDPELFLHIIQPDDLSIVQILLSIQHIDQAIFRICRKDGKIFQVEARATNFFSRNGQLLSVQGVLRPISEQRAQVGGLLLTDYNLHAYIQKSETGMVVVSTQRGVILDANPAFLRDLGLIDDVVGHSIQEFSDWVFPEDREVINSRAIDALSLNGIKIHMRNRLGENLMLEFSQDHYNFGNQDCTLVTVNEYSVHQQLQHYIDELSIVSEVGRTLAENLPLPEIYNRLAKTVLKLFPDTSVLFISRFDPDTKLITCAYARVNEEILDPVSLPPVKLNKPGRGVQSDAIHQRQPVIFNDLREKYQTVEKLVLVGGDEEPEGAPRSSLCVPMMSQDEVLGVLQLQSSAINRFDRRDAELLSVVGNTTAIALKNADLVDNLYRSNEELLNAYDKTPEGWVYALDLRDRETEGHTKRVADMAVNLARELSLGEEDLLHMKRGALLHDIGKIGVPDNILLKPGALDVTEWTIMRQHPQYAYNMIHPIDYLTPAIDISYAHHEKWDGSGYPQGLKGTEIPLSARIFAVIDVWDALISDRPYRPAWKKEKALDYIQTSAGTHFDPQVVAAFITMQYKEQSLTPLVDF